MKIKSMAALLLALAMLATACSEKGTPEVPQEPNTPENPNTPDNDDDNQGGDNQGGNEEDNSWMDEVIDTSGADYLFKDGITGRVMLLEYNGLSNDYISLYNNESGLTLFLDLYSPKLYDYVTPGIYTLGDGSAMTAHREYCYICFPDETLMRFVEGKVKVITDAEHSSGYPYYNITARFVNDAGEIIVADYEGQLVTQ
ncbi:MAG: hypothetical protein J6Q33_02415 [Alistipes sp.]|nr:hypothetical protein [Alistipes sp.]